LPLQAKVPYALIELKHNRASRHHSCLAGSFRAVSCTSLFVSRRRHPIIDVAEPNTFEMQFAFLVSVPPSLLLLHLIPQRDALPLSDLYGLRVDVWPMGVFLVSLDLFELAQSLQ